MRDHALVVSTLICRLSTLARRLTCADARRGGEGRVAAHAKLVASERGRGHMVFKVGETVVYPHHGAALIEAIETRVIKGEEKQYLVLKVAQGDLTVRVPADNAEIVGVRDVVGQEGLDRVFDVLRAPHTEEPTNWSRRYKANLEKLASGDVNKVAEVVRDLWRREKDRGLSAGEKRMLAKARQILVSELALAEGTDEGKAETLLDEVLATAV
jgi:CarD family transcriptional regulator